MEVMVRLPTSLILVHFGQPLTIHQRGLTLAVTLRHHLVRQKKEPGIVKIKCRIIRRTTIQQKKGYESISAISFIVSKFHFQGTRGH